MKKLLVAIMLIAISCFAGQMVINLNNGTPTTIDFSDIASMEIVTATMPENMILVEGGTFQMGEEVIAAPVHSVTLSSFYIGKYEVTQSEWLTTMGTNPSNYTGDIKCPVEQISWYDILVYCNKRSIAENLVPCYTINGSTDPSVWGDVPVNNCNAVWDSVVCNWSANGYRLPTESEWEFAARGGNSSHDYFYSGSDELNDVAWNINNSQVNGTHQTHPVGTKLPNEVGVYDMTGNVWEWTWDWYDTYNASNQTNPTGAETGYTRSVRGGCYFSEFYHTVAYRGDNVPQFNMSMAYGFRVVRSN